MPNKNISVYSQTFSKSERNNNLFIYLQFVLKILNNIEIIIIILIELYILKLNNFVKNKLMFDLKKRISAKRQIVD